MWKKILKRSLFVGLAAIITASGFLFGYGGVVYAKAWRGWDYPWDPPNYYSHWSISWADTNNPSFFYRDLGWQSGHTYDHQRYLKNELENMKLLDWLNLVLEKLGLQIQNMKPLQGIIMNAQTETLHKQQEATQNLNQSEKIQDLLHGALFRDPNRYDEDTNDYADNFRERHEKVGDAYTGLANAAGDALKEIRDAEGNVTKLLDVSNNAESDMQVQQAKVQMQALQEDANARRDALLAQLAQAQAVKQRIETDENLAYWRQVNEAQIYVEDPYHRTDRQKQEYERPEGRGFVDFQ